MKKILELSESNLILGEIYLITNINNNMLYVGQTRTHRKNKNKYRAFGSLCRFKDHISEAINNTKMNQCKYLNNAIRKFGADKFKIEILEMCNIEELNNKEQYYIKKYNTLYPYGYNLTIGGKKLSKIKIINNDECKSFKKRGRPHGYKHTDETKNKMKEFFANEQIINDKKKIMSVSMSNYYEKRKLEILKNINIHDDIKQYIKAIYYNNSNIIKDYIIKIEHHKLTLRTSKLSIDEKYNKLFSILDKAKKMQNTNFQ